MSLLQTLPPGELDIIGDIHGEYDALCQLLAHLGYSQDGQHPTQRTLVFVGDYCDRGPDSPAVLALVKQLVRSGRAVAILGNHELNLLREDPKDGSGWFFDERSVRDAPKYAPTQRPNKTERAEIIGFLSTLPIALERDDLRVVHAAWIQDHIEAIRSLDIASLQQHYEHWDRAAQQHANALIPSIELERVSWPHDLEHAEHQPPLLLAHAERDATKQMMNPIRVLTSGVERICAAPFFASGKWRFVERVQWWQEYSEPIPVVVGHYWRQFSQIDRSALNKGDPDLFKNTLPQAWHGAQSNVFCIDFSVGGRWLSRKSTSIRPLDFKLAALQWPERILRFDDGQSMPTVGFR